MKLTQAADKTVSPTTQYIILDTCIIQAAASKEKYKAHVFRSCLDRLGQTYRLALSEITIYENLHGLWGTRAEQAEKILKVYEWKEISTVVLYLASRLGGLYGDSGIGVGDQIIAATAILENGLVLTENHKDFPNPYFTQKEWFPLSYEKGNGKRTNDVILYQPQIKLIGRQIEDRDRGIY